MPTDQERLVVSLEARVNQFEKSFQKANRTANDNFQRIERRAKQSGDKLEKALGGSAGRVANSLEGMFAPFLRGGVVFTATAAATVAIGRIAKSVAEVDREARKAGVSAKTWQQWAYVATATGATIDGVTDALKEMNIRANEFALTGKGSGAEWFQRLGYSADEVAAKLKDPNRFLDEIIGKIQKLDRASQTRALDELFGGTGAEQLSKVLGNSVDEIRNMRNEAATFTDEQIEAAKKIDAEFATLWRNFTVYAKEAAIEGVGYVEKIIGAISKLKGDSIIADARDKVLAPDAQLARLQARRVALADKIAKIQAQPATGDMYGPETWVTACT